MKILVISYYYPPCNSIASERTNSFVKFLINKGIDIKIITRHWEGDEKKWEDYLVTNNTPIKKVKKNDLLEEIFIPYNKKKSTKFNSLLNLLRGYPSLDIDVSQFSKTIDSIVKRWKPNYIFTSAPPLSLANLTYWKARKHKTPYLLDFRDFENDFLLNKYKKFPIKRILFFHLRTRLIKNSLKNAYLISSITPPITDYFLKFNKNTITVTNGYEPEEFNTVNNSSTVNSHNFILSLIGTIYPNQEYDSLHQIFNQFVKYKKDVIINFIGAKSISIVDEDIRRVLPNDKINITDRIDRISALKYMNKSNILFYYGWKGHEGIYSGKIFEYLGARKNILIHPSDNDVLEKVIKSTNTGLITDSKRDVIEFLESKYNEWKKSKKLSYYGIEDEIIKYTRQFQFLKIYNKIK